MNSPADGQYKALMAKALVQLRELRARLTESDNAKHEPIAIVGNGCRFPGAESPDEFWNMLQTGTDAVSEAPAERWDVDAFYDPDPEKPGKMYTRHGGFLKSVDSFDADFFGITPRELVRIDPQHRLLLEVSWEALENAGIAPESLFGSLTGVFVGISSFDYATFQLGLHNARRIDAYVGTGIALSAANGRLSYLLGLNGPSMAVDTACSSSLVALHLACQSLRNRECGLALAGGVNLLLIPELTINFCKARMLAPDGRCKTFDAAADGYVRGEGCGVVVLKRLSDAEADGDTVQAIIRGSAVNQDGSSGGLTVPSGPSQEAVIRRALDNGRISPDQVSYVEAHGTGTALGDPIELRSIGRVFGGRSLSNPLIVGSVKTNVGHLEAASGMAGLLKVVSSLRHGQIPAHLHFRQPNPHIAWDELPLEVPTELRPWSSADGPRLAGVSSFGFSGTNVHVVLEEAPARKRPVTREGQAGLNLLTLSAKSEEALMQMVGRYGEFLASHPGLSIGDICYTANMGRSHFNHRLAVCASCTSELCAKLIAFRRGERPEGVFPGLKGGAEGFVPMESVPEDLSRMLLKWAEKYAGGASLDWKGFYKGYPCSRTELPTYPFQRQRYWLETHQAVERDARPDAFHPLLGRRLSLPGAEEVRFESMISLHSLSFLGHHRVYGYAVLPAAAYVEMVLAAGLEVFGSERLCISSLSFFRALVLPENGHRTLHLVLKNKDKDRARVSIFSKDGDGEWTLHAEGDILAEYGEMPCPLEPEVAVEGAWREIAVSDYYRGFEESGMQYGPLFQALEQIRSNGSEVVGRLGLPEASAAEKNRFVLHPVLFDACLQLLKAAMPDEGKDVVWLPVGFSLLRSYRRLPDGAPLWCYAGVRLSAGTGPALMSSSFELRDDQGHLVVSVEGISARRADRKALFPEMPKKEHEGAYPESKRVSTDETQAGQSEIAQKVMAVREGERKAVLLSYIRDLAAEVMGLGASRKIPADRPLMELGFDSLMAVEFKNLIERDLCRQLPAGLVFNYPSLNDICQFLEEELFVQPVDEGKGNVAAGGDEFDYLDDMDAGELEDLIRKEVR